MTKRMLIDATHPEETRVAVVDGNKLEEFDFENAARKQLKGSIYLAKVTRVEPSLQAAFFDYGGNRHGFLPFPEIHPDYYKIPVADREALLEETRRLIDEEEALAEGEEPPAESNGEAPAPSKAKAGKTAKKPRQRRSRKKPEGDSAAAAEAETGDAAGDTASDSAAQAPEDAQVGTDSPGAGDDAVAVAADAQAGSEDGGEPTASETSEAPEPPAQPDSAAGDTNNSTEDQTPGVDDNADGTPRSQPLTADMGASVSEEVDATAEADTAVAETPAQPDTDEEKSQPRSRRGGRRKSARKNGNGGRSRRNSDRDGNGRDKSADRGGDVEIVSGDEVGDDLRRRRRELLNRYKIQEVIKRRQVMLVQIAKEERGTKGAAATTYLSLPGRYCVLMPNTPRGGGISRKISNPKDRRRLKEILTELDVPQGMSVILRTAGLERTKAEIKRDLDYLLRLWDRIRMTTLESTAPTVIYEEGNLVKRAIRDLYRKDIDEVLVAGEDGYRMAKDFMKLLMPSHAKKVQPYRDETIPLFHRYQVESQVDQMHDMTVTLKSGGYVVINHTEALIAIDVNSGKSTRERDIEETALQTNLEAAEEIARQMRLRDLGGIVVVDFIDMEDPKNDAIVERKFKEHVRRDRARIQMGRISSLGLLELSRQRLRPSLMETAYENCPTCVGSGRIRSVSSTALQILRSIEEESIKQRGGEIMVNAQTQVALFLLNNKRSRLSAIEQSAGVVIHVVASEEMPRAEYKIERVKGSTGPAVMNENRGADVDVHGIPLAAPETSRDNAAPETGAETEAEASEAEADAKAAKPPAAKGAKKGNAVESAEDSDDADAQKSRRRGRRGGRRRTKRKDDDQAVASGGDGEAADTGSSDDQSAAEHDKEPDSVPPRAEDRPDVPGDAPQDRVQTVGGGGEPDAGEQAAPGQTAASESGPESGAMRPQETTTAADTTETVAADKPGGVDQAEAGAEDTAEEKDYEVVNQPPEKPRRGWWSRLTGN